MKKIEEVFSALTGQLVWSACRGYAGYLRMEFGRPHIQLRNPKISHSELESVRDFFSQRRIHLCGQWNLLIFSAKWTVSFKNRIIVNDDASDNDVPGEMRKVLDSINGQKLKKFNFDAQQKVLCLTFDLGGEIRAYFEDDDMNNNLWSINFYDDGDIYAWSYSNGLEREAAKKCLPGEINEI